MHTEWPCQEPDVPDDLRRNFAVTPLTLGENMLLVVESINTYRDSAYMFTGEGKQASSIKFAASLCVHTHLLLLLYSFFI